MNQNKKRKQNPVWNELISINQIHLAFGNRNLSSFFFGTGLHDIDCGNTATDSIVNACVRIYVLIYGQYLQIQTQIYLFYQTVAIIII